MNIWGQKTGYYAVKGFESHVGGITTRAQAKIMAKVAGAIVGVFVLLATALVPVTANASESDMMVAVKFQYNFGEPVRKSEFRVGMFTADMDETPSLDMGLLELRVGMGGGTTTPYMLERPIDQGVINWGISQVDRVKRLLGQ